MGDVKVPELSSEELLVGNEEEVREKIANLIDKAVSEAGKPSPEVQKTMEEAMKGLAIFGDDDEDVRDYAKSLFEKEVRKLAAEAKAEDYKAAAEGVSKRVAKLLASRGQPPANDGNKGPISSGGGSAAAAHVNDTVPHNMEEAEAYADKIAASFSKK